MSVFAKVARKIFNSKITEKNGFSDRVFYVAITDSDIGSPKSLRTLFDKYLSHNMVKFEQNRMIENVQNFRLFAKKKS